MLVEGGRSSLTGTQLGAYRVGPLLGAGGMLAALNHPHIAAIYGLEQNGGALAAAVSREGSEAAPPRYRGRAN